MTTPSSAMPRSCLGATPGGWKIAAIDPDGADLRRDEEVLRLPFATPVYTAGALRKLLAELGRADKNLGDYAQKLMYDTAEL